MAGAKNLPFASVPHQKGCRRDNKYSQQEQSNHHYYNSITCQYTHVHHTRADMALDHTRVDVALDHTRVNVASDHTRVNVALDHTRVDVASDHTSLRIHVCLQTKKIF